MKALIVVGARPEAIKLWSVKEALGASADVWFTGQHSPEMLGDILSANIKTPLWSFYDVVVVQGDTRSAFEAAYEAFLAKIPVAHVEAGLRSGTKRLPFPEEMLRRLISEIADIHFAPTPLAVKNLGDRPEVHLVGNTVVDAALHFRVPFTGPRPFVLFTLHRRESWGRALDIFHEVRRLVDSGLNVVYPVHPSVKSLAEAVLGDIIVPPLPYGEMLGAIEAAQVILTDSGGIQEEATIFGTPTLVLRDVTERPEASARLIGTSPKGIFEEVWSTFINPPKIERSLVFGDGHAGPRIAQELRRFCGS